MVVRSAELRNLSSFKINRKNRNNPDYLCYPSDIKDDTTVNNETFYGQDRIIFTLYEYLPKPETLATFNSNSATNSENYGTPFKEVTNRDLDYKIVNEFVIGRKTMRGENGKNEYINNNINKVILPIQDKIADQNGVEWEGSTLNDLQRRLANLAFNAMKGDGTQIDNSAAALSSVLSDPSFGDYGRLFATQEAIGLQNLMVRATGKIINPNLELLFKGPTLRPFTFNFKLSPRDVEEGIIVTDIIKFFKKAMAPRVGSSNLFLEAPYVFGIEYFMGSKNVHPGLNLIKKCALTNCVVDYTPNNSYMTYKDGTMVAYSMNLTLQEIIPVYDIDYYDGKNPENEVNTHSIGY